MIAIHNRIEEKQILPNTAFWKWVRETMEKLDINYREVNEAGGKTFAGGSSTIWRAIHHESDLTLPMVATIAKAFGMSRFDVLHKAKFLKVSPEDADIIASMTAMEIYEVASKLSIAKQKDLLKMTIALLGEDEADGSDSS